VNFFTDNDDLQFHFRQGVAWDRFVPLWEEGFRFEDGPRSLDEARELYDETLREVGQYAAREIAPHAREIDEQGVAFVDARVVHPPALLRNIEGLKKLGVMGVNLPRDLGGSNFPMTAGTFLAEVLSRSCTNTFLLHVFHQAPAVPIARFGTREQAERWVPRLAAGEISGSVAMTEPDAGSDVGNVSTTAVPEDGHWRVTGRKQFITNGCGDVSVVLARTEPGSKGLEGLSLLVVPRVENGRDNFRVARPEKKMVIRGSATCELSFEGSCAELLGPRGAGFSEILTFMNEARMAVAIQGLGIAEAAWRAARAYAERRVQMGKPIARHEMVADMLLDMETELAALRALVYRCVQLQDRILGLERGKGDARELAALKRALRDRTPLLKWFGSERVLWITRTAVQVHGGYGVVQDYDVERHYRDALILPIYEGTSQIQALMSLKDQARWATERPWRLFTGAVSVEAAPDVLGDGVRDLAAEYNRALRYVLRHRGRDLAFARLQAERLTAMLAHTRAAEALAAHAPASARHRRLAERFVARTLPLLRMHGDVIRSGDHSTLESLQPPTDDGGRGRQPHTDDGGRGRQPPTDDGGRGRQQ
jgi:alkylation response protein AidB-like acyl-CoA dehydrogenase